MLIESMHIMMFYDMSYDCDNQLRKFDMNVTIYFESKRQLIKRHVQMEIRKSFHVVFHLVTSVVTSESTYYDNVAELLVEVRIGIVISKD